MNAGKIMMVAGAILLLLGALVWLLGKSGFKGLPGDIRYESENVKVYFPIVTCLVVSLGLTLLFWLWQWWKGR